MTRAAILLLLSCLGVTLAGCSAAPNLHNPVEIDRAEYTRMFLASEAVLREYGFTIERRDHRFGEISTPPQVSPAVIEPWKHSNTTLYQAMSSTMNKTRRVVRVSIEPVAEPGPAVPSVDLPSGRLPEKLVTVAPGPDSPATQPAAAATQPDGVGTYLLTVEVQIEQFQSTTRRLNGTTRGSGMVSNLHGPPGELVARGIPPSYWFPTGRDPYLEERLLTEIVRRSVYIR
ncbi:MAG: hypothetical protein K8S99_06710 [Planctomycetes bacterium]|nr:hypothetical protein [Planctomycetota bacterium]